jgi:hypothetical protein
LQWFYPETIQYERIIRKNKADSGGRIGFVSTILNRPFEMPIFGQYSKWLFFVRAAKIRMWVASNKALWGIGE